MSTLDQLVEKIVEVAQPTHVYLFGSQAKGKAHSDSDYDFLIITDRPVHTRQESRRIRRGLRGFNLPIDLIVARSEQVARYKDNPSLIYHTALKEGKAYYEIGTGIL